MKKSVILILLLLIPVLCYAHASITFNSEEYDFGTVAEGSSIEHVFEFTNTGDQDLVIEKLTSS